MTENTAYKALRVPRTCRRFRHRLAGAADSRDGRGVVDLALRRHLRSCGACRSEFEQHRTIGRAMRGMRGMPSLAGLPSVAGVPNVPSVARIPGAGRKRRIGRQDPGTVGLFVVVVLGALSALGVGARRRS
jgi:hypothetical protein